MDTPDPEKLGWGYIIGAIVLPIGAFLGRIIHGRIKRSDSVKDRELADRREDTAKWHHQQAETIADLRRQVAERDARIVHLTDRLIEAERDRDKDAEKFVQAIELLKLQLRRTPSSRPPGSSSTKQLTSAASTTEPTVPSLMPPGSKKS